MRYLIPALYMLAGFIIGIFFAQKGCFGPTTRTEYVETVKYKILTKQSYIHVPKPVVRTIYKTKEIERLVDSIRMEYCTDTLTVRDSVPVYVYRDSVSNDKYKMVWESEVLGRMLSFQQDIEIYSDSTVVRVPMKVSPWSALIGVSHTGGLKYGLGYKGFFLEANYSRGQKWDNIYLTKRVTFPKR